MLLGWIVMFDGLVSAAGSDEDCEWTARQANRLRHNGDAGKSRTERAEARQLQSPELELPRPHSRPLDRRRAHRRILPLSRRPGSSRRSPRGRTHH